MRLNKFYSYLLVALAAMVVSLPGHAGMVGTAAMSANAEIFEPVAVRHQRDWITEQLVQGGVDRSDAVSRVASMTDSQVSDIHQRMDSAPAGGADALVVLLVVFVVLEITGYIDVIPER